MPAPGVSLVIIHHRNDALTAHALRQLSDITIRTSFEVVLVDNGSPSPPALPAVPFPLAIVTIDGNGSYAAACNRGAEVAGAPLLFFLNNDIDFDADFVTPLVEALRGDARIGAIGPALFFPDGRFQLSWGDAPGLFSEVVERARQRQSAHGGGRLFDRRREASASARDVEWITGAAMLVTRDAFDAVGGFDEEYRFYFEDSDLCARVRALGRAVRYEPAARLTHFGGGSQAEPSPAIARMYRFGQLRYYARHRSRVSFSLLKTYLSAKAIARAFRDPSARPALRELLAQIARFSAPPFRS